MVNKRPYAMWYDVNLEEPVANVVDNPANDEFLPAASSNRRVISDSSGNVFAVGDQAVNTRGAKAIVWSSEGFVYNGVTIPALTTNQKKATGNAISTNIAAATFPAGMTAPTVLDVSAYRYLVAIVNLSAITGTSIQYEIDTLDDTGTAVSLPMWKPAALTAGGSNYVAIGAQLPFVQTAAAATAVPSSSFNAIAVPSGWTYSIVPLPFTPNANFAWTASSLTAATWTAWIYGIY